MIEAVCLLWTCLELPTTTHFDHLAYERYTGKQFKVVEIILYVNKFSNLTMGQIIVSFIHGDLMGMRVGITLTLDMAELVGMDVGGRVCCSF